uniref:Uncharacterized protein n=1 Tax=Anguilla anguilla TaxID=7936 RepID=A0A0E9WPJ7_ANGAN
MSVENNAFNFRSNNTRVRAVQQSPSANGLTAYPS